MRAFVSNFTRRRRQRSLSPAFQHTFAHEVLKTERLRIIALIVVATVVTVSLGVVDFIAPDVLNRIWRGHFPVLFLATGYVVFVLFEASVLALVTRQMKRSGDVPHLRRYIGAFIETSLPSVVIATHMSNMGAPQALAYVGPFLYFIFIILSTLVRCLFGPQFFIINGSAHEFSSLVAFIATHTNDAPFWPVLNHDRPTSSRYNVLPVLDAMSRGVSPTGAREFFFRDAMGSEWSDPARSACLLGGVGEHRRCGGGDIATTTHANGTSTSHRSGPHLRAAPRCPSRRIDLRPARPHGPLFLGILPPRRKPLHASKAITIQ
jgi:hypothetical protein